jgi:hypothetical protein
MAARHKPPEAAHLGWDDATGAERTSAWFPTVRRLQQRRQAGMRM